jgi:hypothetical protein
MDKPNPNLLFKAVKKGDLARVRELLAAGTPIEATDMNRFTPLMLAAQAGQGEVFRLLVDAGANLLAMGLDQSDLIGCAAEGGDPEILRFVLGKGHPVEGHWQPRSPAAKRQGRITPLIAAAINGHVEAVRLLLEAGADRDAKFDGETARKMVEQNIEFPIGPEESTLKPRYEQIVALLGGKSAPAKPAESVAAQEVERFAANARKPAFARIRERLVERCGRARAWRPVPDHGIAAADVSAFTLRRCKNQETLDELQEETRRAGFLLVLAEPWLPGEDAALVLFPTADPFAVVVAVGTEGANHGVRADDVVAWLQELEQSNPFALRCCGHDIVGGIFLAPVKSAKKLAEQIAELCPDVLGEGMETPAALARALTKSRSFLLRWS